MAYPNCVFTAGFVYTGFSGLDTGSWNAAVSNSFTIAPRICQPRLVRVNFTVLLPAHEGHAPSALPGFVLAHFSRNLSLCQPGVRSPHRDRTE